ncbi:hypothetical protein RJT34_32451 [Clitoria ternatea]|uniref:Uncharacterized protein n=1 Tax=Clitoria ternatea TaxID=43366 RepID=A0AAN9EW45_CLITE
MSKCNVIVIFFNASIQISFLRPRLSLERNYNLRKWCCYTCVVLLSVPHHSMLSLIILITPGILKAQDLVLLASFEPVVVGGSRDESRTLNRGQGLRACGGTATKNSLPRESFNRSFILDVRK